MQFSYFWMNLYEMLTVYSLESKELKSEFIENLKQFLRFFWPICSCENIKVFKT